MPPTLSPTVVRMRAALAQRFPKARVHTWSAGGRQQHPRGLADRVRQAHGPASTCSTGRRSILSLDSDFLQTESGAVRASKSFAASRRLRSSRESMNRLYVVEPARTTTGNMADHRLRLAAGDVEKYAFALAAELMKQGVPLGPEVAASVTKHGAGADGVPPKWLAAVAKDLVSNRARALVVVGARQPAVVHALAHAMNAALGAIGATVTYAPVADPDELDVADRHEGPHRRDGRRAGRRRSSSSAATPSSMPRPTSASATSSRRCRSACTPRCSSTRRATSAPGTCRALTSTSPGAMRRALDGTISIQQPLIAPLYAGRDDIELLAQLANSPEKTGHDAVRNTANGLLLATRQLFACGAPDAMGKLMCQDAAGNAIPVHLNDLDREWNRALSAGVLQRAPARQAPVVPAGAAIAAAIDARKAPARGAFEATFAPCPKMVDGRYANNTWLQEMPDPSTKLVWDNAAILSPATAKELQVENKDFVKITAGDRSVTAAVWIVPGQADHSVSLSLGWGRTKAGRIGNGRGFNAYPLRSTDSLGFASNVTVAKTGDEPYFFAQTQENSSTEDRPIAHEATLAEYAKSPNFSELAAPPQRSLPLWEQADYSKGHQWGMAIDLNACTGCSACVIACMSENNIPVVGKREVWRGREMHWLRIDRYYVERAEIGATAEDPAVVYEPLACVHCEEAPCENVCPVNATTHGPEGLNEMAYNRCIGTRYCANNCPYKVRKFNYLNWHNDVVWKDTGGLPETLAMQQNPNVTVRFRGVMEKCTYCVQRIQSAKIKAKREYRQVRDGEIRTACQQTCPSDAIVFGDINDPNTPVPEPSRIDRRFGLLAELGTRPRTTYLGKVRNPNPEMA